MSSDDPVVVESNGHTSDDISPHRRNLLDRMDATIGETSAGIGSLLTELIRRALRGGVSNIDQHLTEFAQEQVQTAVVQELPTVRNVAAEVADTTSRTVAEAAMVKLTDEVESKTRELSQTLSDADQKFTTALTETDQRLTEAITQTASQLDETTQSVNSTFEQIQADTLQATTQLSEKISTSKQETDSFLRLFETELRESAKRSWQKVNVHLDQLREQTSILPSLTDRLTQSETARQQAEVKLQSVQAEFQRSIRDLQNLLQDVTDRLAASVQENQTLSMRVEELERPRGIRALWQRLRGGKPKELPEEDAAEEQ